MENLKKSVCVCVCVGGGGGGGIVNTFQTYDYHIYFNYDILQIRFFITILYILSPRIQYCFKKSYLKNFSGGCAPGAPPSKSALAFEALSSIDMFAFSFVAIVPFLVEI